MTKLIFLNPVFQGQAHNLIGEKTTVGRLKPNDLVIPCESVSARHCEILVWGQEVIVRDLNSANGTFVDAVRLNNQAPVRSGQIIRFGSVQARVEIDPPTREETATEITAVYAHDRAVQAMAAPPDARDTTAVLQSRNASPLNDSDQTILMEDQGSRQVRPVQAPSDLGQTRALQLSSRRWMWKAAMGVAVLALLIWLAMKIR